MQVNQGLLNMLASSTQGSAVPDTSAQPESGGQDVRMSDSASKGSEELESLPKTMRMIPWMVGVRSQCLTR